MRLLFAIVLLGMLMSGRAGASSFVALPPAAKQVSPSVIYFSGPEPQLAKAEPGDASPELPPLPTPELASPPRLAGAAAKPDATPPRSARLSGVANHQVKCSRRDLAKAAVAI